MIQHLVITLLIFSTIFIYIMDEKSNDFIELNITGTDLQIIKTSELNGSYNQTTITNDYSVYTHDITGNYIHGN